MTTVDAALAQARRALADASDAPDLDASRLLLSILGRSEASWLAAHSDVRLSTARRHALEDAVRERQSGKPLAYILGAWEFYGREFLVNERVLIPRPATEHLVVQALEIMLDMNKKSGRSLIVADIGTGSGCIAITLLLESPMVERVYATDISPEALQVARRNAQRHAVQDRIEFLSGSMLDPLKGRSVDLIVSNPPYVPTEALTQAGGSRDTIGLTFEPRLALDGGADGQRYLQAIQASGVPALVESTGGRIENLNL